MDPNVAPHCIKLLRCHPHPGRESSISGLMWNLHTAKLRFSLRIVGVLIFSAEAQVPF